MKHNYQYSGVALLLLLMFCNVLSAQVNVDSLYDKYSASLSLDHFLSQLKVLFYVGLTLQNYIFTYLFHCTVHFYAAILSL